MDLQVNFPDGSTSLVPAYAAVEVARGLWQRFGQPGAITAAALIEEGMRAPEGTGGITLDQRRRTRSVRSSIRLSIYAP